MRRELIYDVMLEPEGVFRSHSVRLRREQELKPGETLDLEGRHWLVSTVAPAKSILIDRRVIAREIVPQT